MLKSNPHLRGRCTITSCDSLNHADAQLGTLAHCDHVLLDQINRIEGEKDRDAAVDYIESLMQMSGTAWGETGETKKKTQKGKSKKRKKKGGKTSDDEEVEDDRKAAFDYIEVQLHGEIDIARDVMRVIAHLDDVKRGRDELYLHDWWGKFRERYGNITVSYSDGDRRINL